MKTNNALAAYPSELNNIWHPHTFPYDKRKVETVPIIEDPQTYTNTSLSFWDRHHHLKVKRIIYGYYLLRGKKPLIIKSAMISHMIPDLLKLFPTAKFIHLYRNGISVCASLTKKEFPKYKNLYDHNAFEKKCAFYWVDCIKTISAVIESDTGLPKDSAISMSYESFTENPLKQLNIISDFIGCAKVFTYDLSKIKSTNWKIGDMHSPKWHHILPILRNEMIQLQYLDEKDIQF
jgi:hypothetical protein